jgi:hypothetical protein
MRSFILTASLLLVLAATTAMATPAVEIVATTDTLLAIKYTGTDSTNTTKPAVLVNNKAFGVHVRAVNTANAKAIVGQINGFSLPSISKVGVMGSGSTGVVGYGTNGVYAEGGSIGLTAIGYGTVGVNASGVTVGVDATSSATNSTAVKGVSNGTTTKGVYGQGTSYGVHGKTTASGSTGVFGESTNGGAGVQGSSSNYIGVYGVITSGHEGSIGVQGDAGGDGIGVKGIGYTGLLAVGDGYGISATAVNGYGAYVSGAEVGIEAQGGTYAGYFSGNVEVDGNVHASGTVTWSDRNLKQNIQPLNKGLDAVMALRPKTYELKPGVSKSKNQGTRYGLIAQDVQPVLPELVKSIERMGKTSSGKLDAKAPRSTVLAVDYEGLIPVLINAIQEQEKRIEALEARLNAR